VKFDLIFSNAQTAGHQEPADGGLVPVIVEQNDHD